MTATVAVRARSARVRLACALAALAIPAASANAVVLPFSEPDFDWFAQGAATPNHIWIAGDYWAQTFNGTGLPSATDLTLDLNIGLDAFPSENLDISVIVNGNPVGSFTLTPADGGLQQ